MDALAKPKVCGSMRVRWMHEADLPFVAKIDREAKRLRPDVSWLYARLAESLWSEGTESFVVESPTGEVVAFLIYELHPTHVRLTNMCVAPAHQRIGLGRAIIDRVKKLQRPIVCDVSEWFTGTHKFLSACGFRAKGFEQAEDCSLAYRFVCEA